MRTQGDAYMLTLQFIIVSIRICYALYNYNLTIVCFFQVVYISYVDYQRAKVTQIMEESDQHSPIPIPKGSYNLNFDDLDENTNPFQTQSKIGNSPTKDTENPFQTQTKLSSSPSESNNNIYGAEDPFKSKNTLSSTPPDREIQQAKKVPRSPADGASDESPVSETVQTSQSLDIEPAKPGSNVDHTSPDTSPVVQKVEKKTPR